MDDLPITALQVSGEITLYHRGPPLDLGPLPSWFYLALSGPDSLMLDPYNQPVEFLASTKTRIFSMTLPAHENQLPATQALQVWAEDFAKGRDPLSPFLDAAEKAISFGLKQGLIDPNRLALGGLSRGGLLASHLAAKVPQAKYLLLFAPLMRLTRAKEFANLLDHPDVFPFDTSRLPDLLYDRHVRIYIGNQDNRVGTEESFQFAYALAQSAHQYKHRPAQIEFLMSPSIGYLGHGTSPEVFHAGAQWLKECLHP